MKQGKVAGLWAARDGERKEHLNRCRICAEVTIPSILPPEGYNHNSVLKTPYQSVGSRCVTTLSAKTVLALFPPNSPFFRFKLDPFIQAELAEQLGEEDYKIQVESGLASTEQFVVDYIETIGLRVPAYNILRQLYVCGNVLIYGPMRGKIKVFRIDQYAARRNPQGEVIEGIIKEGVSKQLVPENLRGIVEQKTAEDAGPRDQYDLFTYIERKGDTYHYYQELAGVRVPGSEGAYPADKPLFNFVAINLDTGADYGHGLVAEHLGDFTSLESLSKSIVEGTASMAKVLFLLDPGGTTKMQDLIEANNTGFASGNAEDVTVLQVDKMADFQIPFQLMEKLEDRLSKCFLSHSGVQRNAERVTAAEIRFMAQELEDALGGIYSILSLNLQAPLIQTIMWDMERQRKMSFLPKGVNPVVITGMEALGRGHDLEKMRLFYEHAQAFAGEELRYWIKTKNSLDKIAAAVQFNADEILNTPEEVAQAKQQEQQMQMMTELGKPAVGPIAGAMAQNMTEGANG